MKYTIDKQEQYTVLTLHDEKLTQLTAPDLKAELVVLLHEGVPNLILDLSETNFIDSSGLSAILRANQLWKKKGGITVVSGATHPTVRKMFELTRIDQSTIMKNSVEESIDFVYKHIVEGEMM
jgi:anti-sigma B factor antagonist